MGQVYTPAAPDKQQVRLRVMDEQVDLTRWTTYSFASNFLTPADGWSMTIGDGHLEEKQRRALRIGATVRLYVENFPLAEGYLERIEIDATRGGGVTYSLHGRDRLGPVVDAVADPRVQFKTGTTLADFLKTLLAPFGWVADEHFDIDNAANRDAKTGGLRGTPVPKRKTKSGQLKSFVIHQLKPHNHEGLFRFISRVAERHGFFVRCSADGDKIIVHAPDFEQPFRYKLVRRNDGSPDSGTNILGGSVVYDGSDQPSIIVADGFSGGGEFGKGRIKSYCVNPYFGLGADGFPLEDVAAVIAKYPEAEPVLFASEPYARRAPRMPPRPMFIHDEESKTQAQLNFFVKRTMSELLRKSLVCHYTVEGHGQIDSTGAAWTPWDVDTVVRVKDAIAGVDEDMYVLGRTFEKSRSGGTFTKLELVRRFSIASGEQVVSAGRVDNTKKR